MFKFLTNSTTLARIDALEKRVLARLDELERRASLLEKQIAVATKTPKLTRGPVTTAPITPAPKPVLEEPRVSMPAPTPTPPWEPAPTVAPAAPPTGTFTPTRKPSNASTPHVAFIIGHTANSKGAHSKTLMLAEYDYWNKVFPERGQTTPHTVGNNMFTFTVHRRDGHGVAGAYREAAIHKPELTVELHFNSHPNPSAQGIEVLAISAKGRVAAAAMAQSFQSISDRPLRQGGTGVLDVSGGGRGASSLSQLKDTVSVLIEPFFGSNPSEARQWSNTTSTRRNVLVATAKALAALSALSAATS